MAREDDFSAVAREIRDVVRAACVEASDSSRGTVEDVVEAFGSEKGPGDEGWCRLRRVDSTGGRIDGLGGGTEGDDGGEAEFGAVMSPPRRSSSAEERLSERP